MDEDNETGWQRVWEHVMARQDEMGVTLTRLYELTGISEGTFRKMRNGTPLTRGDKRRTLCDGLGWMHGSIDLILAGGEPMLAEMAPTSQLQRLESRMDAMQKRLDVIEAMIKRLGPEPPRPRQ